ncbi:MAG: HAD-IA family hydrolase [Candidatus Nanoarchaeia archaeon]
MRSVFSVIGHPNILATHTGTLEFTKDDDMSENGDCIIGVSADFSVSELKKLVRRYKVLKCTVKAGIISDSFFFSANKGFSDKEEIVIRRSGYLSERTLGIRTEKAAIDIDRRLINRLKNKTKATVIIEPKIKLLIFDFDDTLEDYHSISHIAKGNIGKRMKRFGADPDEVVSLFDKVHEERRKKGQGHSPAHYDIASWISEIARRLKIRLTRRQAGSVAKSFWDDIQKMARPFPDAKKTLAVLRTRYSLAMLTDSDGPDDRFKIERVKKMGFFDFFDAIITGNSIGQNKPSKRLYTLILKTFEVSPDECVMIGDKEDTDLKLAHDLGMETILVDKHNLCKKGYSHVNHRITEMKQLLDIL